MDLSYNDRSLAQIKSIVKDTYETNCKNAVSRLLNKPNAKQKYKKKKKLKADIRKMLPVYSVPKSVLEESYVKQYLKMICNCIYTKVDEADQDKREMAYKSFHILANYLESKGVTGIIYPCTRTRRVAGKNLVLFNVEDAAPIPGSIREYYHLT